MENSKSIRSNTGYKGIIYDKDNNNFQAYLNFKTIKKISKAIYIGSSLNRNGAIKMREDFIKSLF
jgi:hypothetical protein